MKTARRRHVYKWVACIALVLLAVFFILIVSDDGIMATVPVAVGALLSVFCTIPSASMVTGVDDYNNQAYAFHYRNIDSVNYYCNAAFHSGDSMYGSPYRDGTAEIENNRAFTFMVKMEYDEAKECLDKIPEITDNQIELFVCYVQQMRLCQRRSRNKEFYDYRERAMKALDRINEERSQLTDRQKRRLLYAESEFAIVSSTYYYYVGLEQQSIDALNAISPDVVKSDTAQFLNYLYNIGAGGILTQGTATDIHRQELDYLLRCYQIAQRGDYPFFMANALEGIAEHLISVPVDSGVSLSLVNPDNLSVSQLPVRLAEESLRLFQNYGDVYQIAGAYRTLASCYRAQGDYESALEYLRRALADTHINQAPDLVASIREQLSVAYAAVDDKYNSDYNRNLYLDLQEQTRQDRQLEARAGQLDHAVTQLNWLLAAVVGAMALLILMLLLFRYLGGRQKKRESPLDEQIEEHREQIAVVRRQIEEGERRHLEQRARISLVNSLLPLIDRIVHEVGRLKQHTPDSEEYHARLTYIHELIDQIESDNELLTHWIQLRQGQLSLRIESFPLQPLFDMVARSRRGFQLKGIMLNTVPTDAVVKADRILTLFMLNTLADNARKFTSEGEVTIYAEETPEYVEISVKDTGVGMDADQLAHVFDHQLTNHGFGLLNCKGIIEKYRKLSQVFKVCSLQAESELGRGSRFFFRLPRGIVMTLVGFMVLTSFPAKAQKVSPLARASIYADSAYFSNINGTYERTLLFADSCRKCLNDFYLQQHPQGRTLMLSDDDTSVVLPEIQWLHDSLPTNYNVILDIRNESAVAALALHEWKLYAYNNRIYTSLFKELSADASLADYCRTMQQMQTNRTIAIVLMLLALLAILLAFYLYYVRPRLNARFSAEQQRYYNLELLDDELRRVDMELGNLHVSNSVLDNCLSTLKHETMYYPSRIRQLVDKGDMASVDEVVGYYRDLYTLLSQQAMVQVERVKLHLTPLEHGILGDDTLVSYLFDILKKQQAQNFTFTKKGEQYIEVKCEIPMVNFQFSAIDRFLCRQIARDHGEATNRRACSFREEINNNVTIIIILLPAYAKL